MYTYTDNYDQEVVTICIQIYRLLYSSIQCFSDIAEQESAEARKNMTGLIEDLGLCPLPDASPFVKYIMLIL